MNWLSLKIELGMCKKIVEKGKNLDFLSMFMFGTRTQYHSVEVTRSKSHLSISSKGGRPLNNKNTLYIHQKISNWAQR